MTGRRLVVVGDTLLDEDVIGDATRLTPDDAAPVLRITARRRRPGGAGLAATMAARDGHDVTLVTALGDDPDGWATLQMLQALGVAVIDLGSDGPTPRKTRVRCGARTLARLDVDGGHPRDVGLRPVVPRCVDRADGVLVADYGNGVAHLPPLRSLLSAVGASTPVVWDPHPRGAEPVTGCWVVTPNEGEAAALTGSSPSRSTAGGAAAGLAAAGAAARELRRRWGARAVCVTRGAHGALMVSDHGPPLAVPATASAGDACGAGDRFAVGVATELLAGALLTEAVARAVQHATRYVADGGADSIGDLWAATAAHRGRRPARRPPRPTSPPLPAELGDDVPEVIRRVRSAGGTVVATGGCFDVLHAGHVSLLEQARRLGDCLVVLLNSDSSVHRLKGPTRPRIGEVDRARVLRALEPVDDVVVFDELTPAEALARLQPDVFVKGGDYGGAQVPETEVLAGWGGHVFVVPYLEGRSSTRILREVTHA